METLRLNLVPQAAKITVKFSYLPRIIPPLAICKARQKWQRVLSALTSLSTLELAEALPELILQLSADRTGFKNAKNYSGFVLALHLMAKNLGMDLRKFC
jgi:hypothetical protein